MKSLLGKTRTLDMLLVDRLQKLSSDELIHRLALLVFIVILVIMHFTIVPTQDDMYFSNALKENTYLEFLKLRYYGWSSRLIIESVLIACYWFNFGLWRMLDVLAFVLIAECFVSLCLNNKRFAFFIYFVILVFSDFRSMHSAGWGATTVNYLWPLACMMPFFVMAKKIFQGEKLPDVRTCLSVLLLVFATNHEQVAALIFGLSVSFLIMNVAMSRKFDKGSVYFGIVVILSFQALVFILTCPGNKIRYVLEIGTWFAEYPTLSLFDKCQIGILTIFTYYISLVRNIVVIPLLVLLTAIFYRKNRVNFWVQIILDAFVVFCAVGSRVCSTLGRGFLLSNNMLAQFSEYSESEVLVECLILLAWGALLVYQIICASDRLAIGLLNAFLLMAGSCSALIIAFSPTVYASGSRSYLFMSYMIFYISFDIFSSMVDRWEKKDHVHFDDIEKEVGRSF